MAAIVWEAQQWARTQFENCALGDRRRNRRLIALAGRIIDKPDASTPRQTEVWRELKAAYRLFDCDEVTPAELLRPHRRAVREACQPGQVKLIVSDTTELHFTGSPASAGLGAVGRGRGRGLVAHTALMVDALTGDADGLAAQELLRRPLRTASDRRFKNSVRRSADRESTIWGRVIDEVGPPPPGVTYLHVCDRGANDYEVFRRIEAQNCGFVIRASKLNRNVLPIPAVEPHSPLAATSPQPLSAVLSDWSCCATQTLSVPHQAGRSARQANLELRYGTVELPAPKVLTPWLKDRDERTVSQSTPLRLTVIELKEAAPPAGTAPIRWVLYTTQSVATPSAAQAIVEHYRKRWTIEEYHKCWKTGCQVESRRYETADRLERVTTVLGVVAVRLLQLRSAARQCPDRPADQLVPRQWVQLIQTVRQLPADRPLTIRDFVRHLAGLGGFLLRKCDGEPGRQTLWRGYETFRQLLRGAEAAQRCG